MKALRTIVSVLIGWAAAEFSISPALGWSHLSPSYGDVVLVAVLVGYFMSKEGSKNDKHPPQRGETE